MGRWSPWAIGVVVGVLMVVGAVTAVVFALLQSHCDGSVASAGSVLVPHRARCRGYGVGAGIGVGMLALGAVVLAAAGVASGAGFRHRTPAHPPAPDPPGGESSG